MPFSEYKVNLHHSTAVQSLWDNIFKLHAKIKNPKKSIHSNKSVEIKSFQNGFKYLLL